MTLPDTRVDATGKLSLGFSAELLHGPVTAQVASPDSGGRDVSVVDYVHDVSLSLSLGLLEHLEVFATLPVRLYQSGAGAGGVAAQSSPKVTSTALRDPRLGLGYSFDDWLQVPDLGLRAALEVSTPLGDSSAFAGNRGFVVMPSITAGYHAAPVVLRAELAARLRRASDFGDVHLGDQGFIGLACGIEALAHGLLFFGIEAYVMPPLGESRAPSSSSDVTGESWVPGEWLFSVSSTFHSGSPWQLATAFGTGLPLSSESRAGVRDSFAGVTVPAWRAILSLHYAVR